MFSDSKKFKWKKVDFDDAIEKYSIDHFSYEGIDEIFADEPEHYLVHKGDVTLEGLAQFCATDEEEVTMHVVDGNLTLKGPFVFSQNDYNGALYVTGNLTCEANAFLGWDAQLFVGKTMTVKGLLATYLTDAGHFAVRDQLVADHWLEAGDRGDFEIGKRPKTKMLRCGEDNYRNFRKYEDDEEEEAPDTEVEAPARDTLVDSRPPVPPEDDDEEDAEEEDDDDAPAGRGRDEEEEPSDEAERFGFAPKEATPIKGILHPDLFENEEDVDIDKLEDAIRDGQPLFTR